MFEYDGKRYDPMRCSRELFSGSAGKINEWIAAYNTSPSDFATEEAILKCVRGVFKLEDWDTATCSGFTDEYVLTLLEAFNTYLEKKG